MTEGDLDIETQGRKKHKKGGRSWSNRALSQGVPKIAGCHQKLRKSKEEFSPRAFRGIMALPTS